MSANVYVMSIQCLLNVLRLLWYFSTVRRAAIGGLRVLLWSLGVNCCRAALGIIPSVGGDGWNRGEIMRTVKKENRATGKPFTKETAAEAGRRSGKARAEKRQLKEELQLLLSCKLNGKTVQEKMSEAIINEALAGNVKAFEVIRDTIGEKPTENINVTQADFSALDSIAKDLLKSGKED